MHKAQVRESAPSHAEMLYLTIRHATRRRCRIKPPKAPSWAIYGGHNTGTSRLIRTRSTGSPPLSSTEQTMGGVAHC